jgi:hypothetical protein
MTRISISHAAFCLIGLACPATSLAQSSSAASSSVCRNVQGTLILQTFSGSTCTSPVGVCGTVQWLGDIKASSTFVATSVVTTADTGVTGVIVTTADAQLTLHGGTLLAKYAVVVNTGGNGDFAEVDTVVGGTGAYANVTGVWRAEGTSQGTSGHGIYQGQLCNAP